MSSEYLWVYGTLRYACSNPQADFLRRSSRYLGPARVQARLYRIDWYPGVLLGGSPQDWVAGDIFELLDPAALPELDRYEGPTEYQRVHADAELPNGGRRSCWVYECILDLDESRRIPSGDWLLDNGSSR